MSTFEGQHQNKSTLTDFAEAFKKELAKQLFNSIDAQELQDPEKVSAIQVKKLNITVNKMNNTKSPLIDMKPKDTIKLIIVEIQSCS